MGSVKLGENEIPRENGFRYLGSIAQADGGLDLEVEKRIQAGWNNWRKRLRWAGHVWVGRRWRGRPKRR